MLIKRTLLYLPSQLLSPIAQFLSILLWTYYCTSETIGIVTLVTTQQELIRTLCIAWWSHFALRFINDKKVSGQEMEHTNIGVVFLVSVLQICVSYLTFLYVFGSNGTSYQFIATAAFVVFRSLNQHNISLATAREDAISYNVLSLSGPVFGLLIGIILLQNFGDDALYPIVGYALGECFGVMFTLYKAKEYLSPFRISRLILLSAIKYGWPILFSGLLAWLALNASRYIIEMKLGLGAVGIYAVGFGLGQRAAGIAAMLVTSAALPLAIKVMQEKGQASAMVQLGENFSLLMSVMAPALVGMFSVNDLLVRLLINSEFWDITLEILPWSILSGGLFAVIYNYLNHYFIVTAKTRCLIFVDGALAILIILLSFPYIDYYGLKGAIIAMCLASFLMLVVLLFYLLLKTDFIFPWKKFLYITASVTIMYLSVVGVRSYVQEPLPALLSSIFVGLFIYALLMAYVYRGYLFTMKNRFIKGT